MNQIPSHGPQTCKICNQLYWLILQTGVLQLDAGVTTMFVSKRSQVLASHFQHVVSGHTSKWQDQLAYMVRYPNISTQGISFALYVKHNCLELLRYSASDIEPKHSIPNQQFFVFHICCKLGFRNTETISTSTYISLSNAWITQRGIRSQCYVGVRDSKS